MKYSSLLLIFLFAASPLAAYSDGTPSPDCCSYESSFDIRRDRWWVDADYLLWTIKFSPEPVPLVATGPVVPNLSPFLDLPGTSVLIGGHPIDLSWRSGGKFAIGCWLDDEHVFASEISYFFLGKRSHQSKVHSNGSDNSEFLAFPFINALTGSESSTRIALPGSFSGTATLTVSNELLGAEWNFLMSSSYDFYGNCKWLGGFRYWNFKDRLTFTTSSPSITVPGDIFRTHDTFHTTNNFYGGLLGAEWRYRWCDLFFNIQGKVALGAMCEKLNIDGELVANEFSDSTKAETFDAGYLAMSTNNGRHTKTRFAVLPEVNINFGYQPKDWCSIEIGYSFLYVNSVLWAGNQVDRVINPTQAPAITNNPSTTPVGPKRPKALLKNAAFWAQGFNIGITASF